MLKESSGSSDRLLKSLGPASLRTPDPHARIHGTRSDVLDQLAADGLITTSTAWKLRNQVQESWQPIGRILRQRACSRWTR